MRRRLLIALPAALLILPVLLLGVLVYSASGVQLISSQLWRLERFGIHIEGVSGTLGDQLRIRQFILDHPQVRLSVQDITIEPQLRGLWFQTLQAGRVAAQDAQVVIRRAQRPTNHRRPRFLPAFMRIDARAIDVRNVRYVHLDGTAIEARHVRGRLTITSRQLRVHSFDILARQFAATGHLRLRAARPLALQGTVNGYVNTGRGTRLAAQAHVHGTVDRLAIQAQLREPDALTAEALLTRAPQHWTIDGRLASPSFSLRPWLKSAPFSLRNVALEVQGHPQQIRVAGQLSIPELSNEAFTLAAQGRWAKRVLTLTAADIALRSASATLHGGGTISFDGEKPQVDLAGSWRNLQWPLHGRAAIASESGAATLRGALPYEFTATAQLSGLNLPPAQGRVRGVWTGEQVRLHEYVFNALRGSLSGAAALTLTQPRRWTISTEVTDVDPATLHGHFPGRINLLAQAQGEGLGRNANFTVALSDLRGTLRGERVRAAGTVHRRGQTWQVQQGRASLGAASLHLDGSWGPMLNARWSLHAPALQELVPGAAGAIDFSGTAQGPRKAPHITSELQASNLRYAGWQAGRVTLSAVVDASGQQRSRLSLQASRLGRGEPSIGRLHISGNGVPEAHHLEIDLTGAPEKKGAPPQAALQLAGRYAQQAWNATITAAQLTPPGTAPALTLTETAQLVVSRTSAALQPLCLTQDPIRLCAQADWQRNGPWHASVSSQAIPLASLLPPQGNAVVTGRLEGHARVFGTPGQLWQGDADLRITDAAVTYKTEDGGRQTLTLGSGGFLAQATPERVDLSLGLRAFEGTYLDAAAHLQREAGRALTALPLTGTLRAQAADVNILPLLFTQVDHAAGLLTAHARLSGTLALPEISGKLELQNGEFDSYRINLALRELNATADFENHGLTFRGQARAGEGRLAAQGQFRWAGGQPEGTLHLTGDHLLVADLPEYRVVASPDLRFQVTGRTVAVSGDVLIPSARLQPAQLTGAVRVSEDARYVGEHPAEQAGRLTVRSEVRIAMGEEVRVDAFGLQGRIVGAVTTRVDSREPPTGRGELNIADGRYEAYGQALQISRGRLLFETSPLEDPGLDIEARRRIETITVGLNVRGTLQQPRLTFFSEPSLPQTQIVSYLLTGKSIDTAAGGDTTAIINARDTLAVQGGGLIASQLGRRLGIEEVGVESSRTSAGEANTALVLGKFLSPRLFISYGISLTESINTLKLRYTISDRWILRTEAGENQSADLEYTIER